MKNISHSCQIAKDVLENVKAKDLVILKTSHLSSLMDFIVVATATSTQHAKALGSHLIETGKKEKLNILGVEGEKGSEWVLVDFGDTVIHIMTEEARSHYDLETLWTRERTEFDKTIVK